MLFATLQLLALPAADAERLCYAIFAISDISPMLRFFAERAVYALLRH